MFYSLFLLQLRRRFTDDVEMECITMRALQWDYEVRYYSSPVSTIGRRERTSHCFLRTRTSHSDRVALLKTIP